MPFYKGKTRDGSDIEEVHVAYVNPDNENEWSSKPYPSQKIDIANKKALLDYMNARYTLDDVYAQIQAKTCELSVRMRQYVRSHYNENGEFIYNESPPNGGVDDV